MSREKKKKWKKQTKYLLHFVENSILYLWIVFWIINSVKYWKISSIKSVNSAVFTVIKRDWVERKKLVSEKNISVASNWTIDQLKRWTFFNICIFVVQIIQCVNRKQIFNCSLAIVLFVRWRIQRTPVKWVHCYSTNCHWCVHSASDLVIWLAFSQPSFV